MAAVWSKKNVDIDKRPATVDEKVRFGDPGIDTVIGRNHKGALLTVNGEVTGPAWTILLGGKDTTLPAKAAINTLVHFRNRIHNINSRQRKGI